MPAPRPHAVLRMVLPGLDIGADAWPARVGAAGYVEVWITAASADDYRPLFQVFGASALPLRAKPPIHTIPIESPMPQQTIPIESLLEQPVLRI